MMSEKKKQSLPVGSIWDLGKGEKQVQRPDGEVVDVTDGLYVLTQPGTYVCGDTEVEAKG